MVRVQLRRRSFWNCCLWSVWWSIVSLSIHSSSEVWWAAECKCHQLDRHLNEHRQNPKLYRSIRSGDGKQTWGIIEMTHLPRPRTLSMDPHSYRRPHWHRHALWCLHWRPPQPQRHSSSIFSVENSLSMVNNQFPENRSKLVQLGTESIFQEMVWCGSVKIRKQTHYSELSFNQ